jgi:hypothetical protein
MIAIGLSSLVVLAAFALFWLVLVVLVGGFADAFGSASGQDSFASEWGGLLASLFGPLGIALALVALLVLVFGFLVSRWILRARGVARAAGVTWAGCGIALVTCLVAGIGFGAVFSAIADSMDGSGGAGDPFSGPLGGLLSSLLGAGSLVFVAGVGALSWWWMAHALRARPPAALVASSVAAAPGMSVAPSPLLLPSATPGEQPAPPAVRI